MAIDLTTQDDDGQQRRQRPPAIVHALFGPLESAEPDLPSNAVSFHPPPTTAHSINEPNKNYPTDGDEDEDEKLQAQSRLDPSRESSITLATAAAAAADSRVSPKEWRKRRRLRLRRVYQIAKGRPSFAKMLQTDYDVSDDEQFEETLRHEYDEYEQEDEQVAYNVDGDIVAIEEQVMSSQPVDTISAIPKRIRIDVDAALGLKKTNKPAIVPVPDEAFDYGSESYAHHPSPHQRKAHPHPVTIISPEEEGWYEGTRIMALPGDAEYLPPMAQWVRQNLEYFSATASDVASRVPGRRTPLVQGRVGIRCIHCAAAAARPSPTKERSPEATPSSEDVHVPRPPKRVLFPVNIAAIHPICSQIVNQHFEHCPNLPPERKIQLLQLVQEAASAKGIRRVHGLPTAHYSIMAAKQLGLVDVERGIRFSRDLSLDPLPFETVRVHVKMELSKTVLPLHGSSDMDVLAAASLEPRVQADAESERVLAEAVAEADDPKFLCKSSDKMFVTDFFFLLMKQMAVCNAIPADFSKQGKKSKSLRIGFAGFCCRWCQSSDGSSSRPFDSSSRSFTSTVDGLSSAITHSFFAHVLKCAFSPKRVKVAIATYKRLHARQMSQLPYGSQRRLIIEIWRRLRAADKTEEEMKKENPEAFVRIEAASASFDVEPKSERDSSIVRDDYSPEDEVFERPPHYPECEDVETREVLKYAIDNWDPANTDGLVLPGDRRLISDYVFLTMRQLKIVYLYEADPLYARKSFPGNNAMAGIGCIHCSNRPDIIVSPSGRSFPSAPDNFASTLNTSLYNHMQACPCIPDRMKRALANLRKIHSAQCSSLQFGSQRRYFNLLHERVKRAEKNRPVVDKDESITAPSEVDDEFILKHGFFKIPAKEDSENQFICKRCRMVPLQFRARGSVHVGTADADLMEQHSILCKKDAFDLSVISEAMDELIRTTFDDDVSIIDHPSFHSLIRIAVGGHDGLYRAFTKCVKNLVLRIRSEEPVETESDDFVLANLWNAFPLSVDYESLKDVFGEVTDVVDGMMSDDIRDYPMFARYLMLLSPALIVPDRELDEIEGDIDDAVDEGDVSNKIIELDDDDDDGGEVVEASIEENEDDKGKQEFDDEEQDDDDEMNESSIVVVDDEEVEDDDDGEQDDDDGNNESSIVVVDVDDENHRSDEKGIIELADEGDDDE